MKILLIGQPHFCREWMELLGNRSVAVVTHPSSVHATAGPFDAVIDVTLADGKEKREILRSLEPVVSGRTLIFTNAIRASVTSIASDWKDPGQIIGIAFLPTFTSASSVEVCFPLQSRREREGEAREFFRLLGRKIEVVGDMPGMVFPRILATIVNEAFFALQQGVATEDAVDLAMKLATNYPQGPFEWARRSGPANILLILESLHAELGDDRYRPCPLLRRFVEAEMTASLTNARER